jgi:hypothetical protein
MRRAIGFSLLLLLAFGCGGGASRPANVAAPTIVIRQLNPIFFGSGSSAPVSLDVHVRNNANVPIRLREVEIRSPSMSQYTLLRTAKLFGETIPPGETRTVHLTATAVRNSSISRMEEPLQVSAFVRLEANGQQFREIILQQFIGEGVR